MLLSGAREATTKYDLENSFNWQKSKLPLPLFGELKLGWALLQWEFGAAGRGHYPDHKLADDLFSTCTWFDIGFHYLPRGWGSLYAHFMQGVQSGCRTGNREKLSNNQVCCLAQQVLMKY